MFLKDGRVAIQDLKYKVSGSRVNEIMNIQTDKPITDSVLYATFGQRLIADGRAVDPAEIYYQYDDLRHVLKLPILFPVEDFRGGGIYLGFDQLYKNNKRLAEKALKGETIELSSMIDYTDMQLTSAQLNSLRKSLKDMGYVEISSANGVNKSGLFYLTENRIKIELLPDTLVKALGSKKVINGESIKIGYKDVGESGQIKAKGDYAISDDKLTIKLLDGVYPEHVEAITRSGKVVSVVVAGSSGWQGGTVRGIARWLLTSPEFIDDPIVNAVLIDNGTDHMLKVADRWVVDSSRGWREGRIQAVILLTQQPN